MNPKEAEIYFGNHIEVPPHWLWWQEGGLGVRALALHTRSSVIEGLIAGKDPEEYTPSGHDRDLEGVKELLRSIQTKGFDPKQRIKVAINPHGQIIITDGLHRSCTALALGLPKVPVEVVYRASEWWRLKEALFAQNGGLSLYQWVEHPDLSLWRGWRRDSEFRAAVLGDYLAKHLPNAIYGMDVACNSGVLTCGLARRGYSMVGIDLDAKCVATGNALAWMKVIGAWCDEDKAPRASFHKCGNIPDVTEHQKRTDFIVCLSLLNHHQVDGRDEQGHEIFRRLVAKAPTVFLDCPAPEDPVGGNSSFVKPEAVFDWCRKSGAAGEGSVVAERGSGLMRTLLAWKR